MQFRRQDGLASWSAARLAGWSRAVFAGPEGPLRLLGLPAVSGSVSDFLDLARLTAGHELDATGGLALLREGLPLELCRRLQTAVPEHFAPSRSNRDWHRRELSRAEAANLAFVAEFLRQALAREHLAADN